MILPNALSLSIIAGIQLIVNTSFPDFWWTPIVLAALIAVAKLLQVAAVDPPPLPQGDVGGPMPVQDSAFKRWLVK